jgi:hypothetical protein
MPTQLQPQGQFAEAARGITLRTLRMKLVSPDHGTRRLVQLLAPPTGGMRDPIRTYWYLRRQLRRDTSDGKQARDQEQCRAGGKLDTCISCIANCPKGRNALVPPSSGLKHTRECNTKQLARSIASHICFRGTPHCSYQRPVFDNCLNLDGKSSACASRASSPSGVAPILRCNVATARCANAFLRLVVTLHPWG